MSATDYDIWLYSNQGNESNYCPHCDAHVDDCRCDEDYALQQQLSELDAQQEASTEYMRGINESKNGMR